MTELMEFNLMVRVWGGLLNVKINCDTKVCPDSVEELGVREAALASALITKYTALDKTALVLIVLLTYDRLSRMVFNNILTSLPPAVGYDNITDIANNCIALR